MKCSDLSKLESEILLFGEMNGLYHSFPQLVLLFQLVKESQHREFILGLILLAFLPLSLSASADTFT
jgi:hypothetical protein